MYKVLLVDDEPMSLVSLKHAFKWGKYGFDVAYETTFPTKALEIITNEKIDVVFTDIRMPKISGIDLIKKARENGSEAEFIIISGFGEFNYAQQALREGVFDYCLKPINQDNAEQLLSKLQDYLNSKQVSSDVNTFNYLISGKLSAKDLLNIKKINKIFMNYQVLCVIAHEPNFEFKADEFVNVKCNKVCLRISENKYVVILNYEDDIMNDLKLQYSKNDYNSLFSVGLSSITNSPSNPSELYKEANMSSNNYFITGTNNFYEYKKTNLDTVKSFCRDIFKSIDYNRINLVKDSIENAPDYFIEKGLASEDATYFWNDIVSYIINKYGVEDLPKDLVFLNYNEILIKFKSFKDLCYYLEEILFSVIDFSQGIPEGIEVNDSFKKLIEYINQNYCDDIQMKELANMFHINYTYCCELFKKVMKVTFSEYITSLRMNKAHILLENSDLSIENIAIETGFSDYYYFNNVFKKYYNITPSKYRKSTKS